MLGAARGATLMGRWCKGSLRGSKSPMQREVMGVSVMRCLYRLIPLYMLICPLIGASPAPPLEVVSCEGAQLLEPNFASIFKPRILKAKFKSGL